MITQRSTLREVYSHPIGKDVIDMALTRDPRAAKLMKNPLIGDIRLSMLDKVFGKQAAGIVDTLLNLLNQHPEPAPPFPANISRKWWKEAVVYQIYPRSFQDSNGDGIGDLAGIKQRIPYLKELGVDVVWLSPIYDSPNDDNGYDIRNYQKIMKEFGNMQSFNALLKALHDNGIKLMMDLVVNHTSDEHEWYQKALEDPQSPERDYYIWAKGKGNRPPNNWTSFFAGPAWNYDDTQDEWALHLFSKKQIDLNWDNAAMRAKIYEMVNWWLEKGIDGFRLDVINFISKGNLADGSDLIYKSFGVRGIEHYFYGPRLHEYLAEMRRESFGNYDVFTVGETPGLGLNMCRMLTAEERGELDLVFNFDHLDNPGKSRMMPYEYDLRHLKAHFLKWQEQYGNNCWPSLFFENHDNPRMVSKVNPDPAWSQVIAKLLAVLQFTLKGTPFIYQGQELGMTNSTFADVSELQDVETIGRYKELAASINSAEAVAEGVDIAFNTLVWGTRDHARTPMQWSGEANAGFTTGTPWLKVNPNYPAINAEAEAENPNSVLNFFKKVIALRKAASALVYGEFQPVFLRDKNTFCYFRTGGGEKYYVEMNFTGDDVRHPGPITSTHKLVLGNYGSVSKMLRPYEANIYKI